MRSSWIRPLEPRCALIRPWPFSRPSFAASDWRPSPSSPCSASGWWCRRRSPCASSATCATPQRRSSGCTSSSACTSSSRSRSPISARIRRRTPRRARTREQKINLLIGLTVSAKTIEKLAAVRVRLELIDTGGAGAVRRGHRAAGRGRDRRAGAPGHRPGRARSARTSPSSSSSWRRRSPSSRSACCCCRWRGGASSSRSTPSAERLARLADGDFAPAPVDARRSLSAAAARTAQHGRGPAAGARGGAQGAHRVAAGSGRASPPGGCSSSSASWRAPSASPPPASSRPRSRTSCAIRWPASR